MVASSTLVEVASFVETTENVQWREDRKKVVFEVSGQEFDPNVGVDALKRYYQGKSYRRACLAAKNAKYDFKSLWPHIVPHKDNPRFLFCWLTRSILPLDCDVVETHVNSKRFLRLRKKEEGRIALRKGMLENRRKNAAAKASAGGEDVISGGDNDDDDGAHELEGLPEEKMEAKVRENVAMRREAKNLKNVREREDTAQADVRAKRRKKVTVKQRKQNGMATVAPTPSDSLSSLRAKMRKKKSMQKQTPKCCSERSCK